MPWEAKRWVVFAGLMFAGSIWAVTYQPDNVQRRSIVDTEGEAPTVPLTRPGPEQPPPSTPPEPLAQPARDGGLD